MDYLKIMGATGWSYFVPFQADITAALERLRIQEFSAGRYSSGVDVTRREFEEALHGVGSKWQSMLEQLSARAADPTTHPQSREKFLTLIAQLEQLRDSKESTPNPKPMPTTIQELLKSQGESGTHSIIDIVRVSSGPAFGAVCPLAPSMLVQIFGTEKPDRFQIETKFGGNELESFVSEPWQAIYIIAYRDDSPAEIFFAGCSGD